MIIILIFSAVIFFFVSPSFRCAVLNPLKTFLYSVIDSFNYLRYKKKHLCRTGELVAYVGLFGKGKTLSVVHKVVGMYLRYNGKPVWCIRRKKWVKQRVQVISNVALSIPYEDFVSLEQIVYCAENNEYYDNEHDTLTVTLVLGDEFSVQMNSRNFKSNIDPLFLNTLLTCRHYHISLYYTAQRFGHVDALLRQVTSYVVDCDKFWRFQGQRIYDAWDLENATNTSLIKPLRRSCWFVRDKDYNAYNTMACVGNLKKSVTAGDMMTSEEILALQCNQQQTNTEGILNPSRRFRKMRNKRK